VNRRAAQATAGFCRSIPLIAPGPSRSLANRVGRATAPIEDIWCEKIRGCSYKGDNTSELMSRLLS